MPSDRAPRAAIVGCAGQTLTGDERRLFAESRPLGFILFARNIGSPEQVRKLVADLRESVDSPDAPVLIDQEGGRVQRLVPPHWRAAPAAARFAELWRGDPAAAVEAARLNARLIAEELALLGIDVDCAPVLDVPIAGAHDVIGDRAHGDAPEPVAALGRAVCEGLLEGGVLPVVKHIPGHGRAMADSHLELPVVGVDRAGLEQDFAPFRALADAPWAMTAHVVYTALDAQAPATMSRTVIDGVIRGAIGFDGVLVSDDLSMKALSGDFTERTRRALAAGCDLVLHCNGRMDEMAAVLRAAAPPTGAALARLARARARKAGSAGFDGMAALARLGELLA